LKEHPIKRIRLHIHNIIRIGHELIEFQHYFEELHKTLRIRVEHWHHLSLVNVECESEDHHATDGHHHEVGVLVEELESDPSEGGNKVELVEYIQ